VLLADLLAASDRVAATRSRLAKISALAECLRKLEPAEIALGVAYLSGETRQGRIGVGWAGLKDSLAAPASAPRLTLAQVDERLERLVERQVAGGQVGVHVEHGRHLFTRGRGHRNHEDEHGDADHAGPRTQQTVVTHHSGFLATAVIEAPMSQAPPERRATTRAARSRIRLPAWTMASLRGPTP